MDTHSCDNNIKIVKTIKLVKLSAMVSIRDLSAELE
jgi:hypothetical protein